MEVLSGMPLDEFLQQRIFGPLGMKDTGFYVPSEKAERLVRYYGVGQDGGLQSAPNSEYLTKPRLLSGGGGLVSTVGDYLKFAQMLLNGGELDGVRILSREGVDLMRHDQLPEGVTSVGPSIDPGNAFGLNLAVVVDSEKAFGQPSGNFYWWGIAGTWFWIDPSNDMIFIGMIQNRDVPRSIELHRATKAAVYAK